MRRLFLVLLTLAALATMVPTSVLVAARLGLEPTHWSGTSLADVRLPLMDHLSIKSPPGPAQDLLGRAKFQDEVNGADVAPSYWDAGAGEVVLGAVTDRGEQLRRSLVGPGGAAYRIERMPHSVSELEAVKHAVIPLPGTGVYMSGTDEEENRIEVTTFRLNHKLFATLADRHGADMVAVTYNPSYGRRGPAVGGQVAPLPSPWQEMDPFGTWFTLLTGFPWYLGTFLLIAAALWTYGLSHKPAVVPAAAVP